MTSCKHCGQSINQVNWYNGPGWKHDGGGWACRPTTFAEPAELSLKERAEAGETALLHRL